ncbi:MAG TPA: BTAD domain-containing putative transcriptional regulator, partial [Acidimicrobiia bacterium]|nr:BTAD domain-containing putative transcriptional regulator [Acidimicrobiia bacterium]
MEFRLLGPLQVVSEGRNVAVGGSRERAVLARLLISPNQVVTADGLIEDLWEGDPPEGAGSAVRVYVSRLRKALREVGADELLVTQAQGYLLRVEPDSLDAARFEALVEKAGQQRAAGDHPGAAATLGEALALWRGPALADVADASFARAEAARLEERRLTALEARIEADLASGRHRELVAELEALTAAHPLRERFWAQRMTALYRADRQAEALAVYQQLRRTLGEELGLDPSAALRRLESAILRQDPQLEWSAPVAPAEVAGGVTAFLFTDLERSTELLARLGDDAADELYRTHFSLLRQAVTEAGGREVKSLGDGVMVSFNSPLAALRCAIGMQQAIADLNAQHPDQRLQLRIGVHVGEAVRSEDDFFGTPVVVVRRLCDHAEGGQILASDLLVGLVGSRGDFRFGPLRWLTLKGLPDPVGAMTVDWRPESMVAAAPPDEAVAVIPMPRLAATTSRIFVGREAELARFRRLWSEVTAGNPKVVFIGGEPGVGKTRLAAEFSSRVHEEGATVLAGHCDENLAVPYQPFVEALRHFVEHTPPVALPSRLGRYPGELSRLLPDLTERAPALAPPVRADPETERYRLFEAVGSWLAGTARSQPLLFVVDDLQWAAAPTLLMLRHLVGAIESSPVLVLGTYRDVDLTRTHPLVDLFADVHRHGLDERFHVGGLSPAEIATLLEARAGHELDDAGRAFADAVARETGGNAFFVVEVLRHLVETGRLVERDGRWTTDAIAVAELDIPAGLRDVIDRR